MKIHINNNFIDHNHNRCSNCSPSALKTSKKHKKQINYYMVKKKKKKKKTYYMVRDFWDTLVYVMYVNVWELIIAFPNGGQWAPFSKVCPLAQTSSYATAHDNY